MVLIEVLQDSFSDVLKIIPFLFVIYLFLEFMEHEAGHKMEHFLEKHRRANPIMGAVLGLLPSCGFAGAASSLFATGVISAGTLIAVYLSSSDEMLSIMISMQAPFDKIWPILVVKLIVAVIAGILIDLLVFARKQKNIDVEEFCEREHDDHSHGIFYSAFLHTVQVTVWLFVITVVFNLIVEWIGQDNLQNFVAAYPNQSVLVSTLVGMIPSCASSILLTKMYLDGVIGFAAVCAGLLVNAGTGMMVLWRVNPNMKENFKIMFMTWICGLAGGLIIELIMTLAA
jgi:hypothetical protein